MAVEGERPPLHSYLHSHSASHPDRTCSQHASHVDIRGCVHVYPATTSLTAPRAAITTACTRRVLPRSTSTPSPRLRSIQQMPPQHWTVDTRSVRSGPCGAAASHTSPLTPDSTPSRIHTMLVALHTPRVRRRGTPRVPRRATRPWWSPYTPTSVEVPISVARYRRRRSRR